MTKDQSKSPVEELMLKEGITYQQALEILMQQEEKKFEQRQIEEEKLYDEAMANLLKKTNRKTVIVGIGKECSEQQAMLIVINKIKPKSRHVIAEIDRWGINKWLVASEYELSYNEAQQISQSLNFEAGKYSNQEVEIIVTENIPFDIR